jgi:hypothetical protein
MIVVFFAMMATVAGFRESLHSSRAGLVVLNFLWVAFSLLVELAMLAGIIVMSGCDRQGDSGHLALRETSLVTRVLERWFAHWGAELYKKKKDSDENRTICGLSWMVTGLMIVYIIGLVVFFIANVFTIGFGRRRVYYSTVEDPDTLMKLGSRVLGFPPFVSLLLAGIFGIPTWLIIRSVAGTGGWVDWPGFSGSIAFWFTLFSVWYSACVQALGVVLEWLVNLVFITIVGFDISERRILRYSPLLLFVIACIIAMPLMAVTGRTMNLPMIQFYLSLFLLPVVVFVILMFVCSEIQSQEIGAASAATASGSHQGGGGPSASIEGRWFPTLGIIMGTLKQKACPIIQQDTEVEPDPEE